MGGSLNSSIERDQNERNRRWRYFLGGFFETQQKSTPNSSDLGVNGKYYSEIKDDNFTRFLDEKQRNRRRRFAAAAAVGVDVPWEEWRIERGIFLSQAFTNSVRTHGRLKIATAFAGLALQVEVLTGRVAEGGRRVVAGWRLGDVRATVVADGD
ncbi:hypothetical protein L484_002135 [Morus notabilis]|uniref:Uncharacterized protein n=1 Tax=Morus notabilis TaxID=981085 RepID=W9QW70_9ROSA|nr:hypothetical protein L484_002135 [Morus notabilis]